jgi:hypothetical protein
MRILVIYLFSLVVFANHCFSQEQTSAEHQQFTPLFQSEEILPIKLSYSIKDLKKDTNDSTYLKTEMNYQDAEGTWKTIAVEIRVRGNYRRAKCDFPPLKLKFKKSAAKGTVFEGNKKLKMVLPCLKSKNLNDDLIKEYLAYRVYGLITPYHFKTRMIRFHLTETGGKRTEEYELLGFLIEDDNHFEKRFDGQEVKRFTHPVHMDTLSCVQNAFFQYLIGNTDYSMTYRHNEKLFRIRGGIVPVPYDFDMTGLVDPKYAVVSEVQNEQLPIEHVTQRLYRGYTREPAVFQQVRQQYLDKKGEILQLLEDHESYFGDPKEFERAWKFVLEFFEVLENDKKFKRSIVDTAREK